MNPGSVLIVNSSLIIIGDLVLNPTGVVEFDSSGNPLVVRGCFTGGGTLVLTNLPTVPDEYELVIATDNDNCSGGGFDSVEARSGGDCVAYEPTIRSRTSVFVRVKSLCNGAGVAPPVAAIVVVLIMAAVLLW